MPALFEPALHAAGAAVEEGEVGSADFDGLVLHTSLLAQAPGSRDGREIDRLGLAWALSLRAMNQPRKRRDVLKLPWVTAALLPTACYRETHTPDALSAEDSARYFPQSVASGDPRPDSVVLWVRVEDLDRPETDAVVSLAVALDPEMKRVLEISADAENMVATAASDYCLGVRLGGLEPDTTYYYRFAYSTLDGVAYSRIGRTRTAPDADSEASVKFAVMCCQDYAGRYYHVARDIAEQDVAFVLHLGDYVYETAGNPAFQKPTDERRVEFSAPGEAIELGSGDATYLAAQSLSNYRDLYKLYRSDPDLQALHERHPIIAVWDDHEFSDDSHGDVSTYRDGRSDEASPERRAAADQAWYEYMPVDFATAPALKLDESGEFPGNFTIYRSFVFGRHLELVVTDLRRFRPDHLIPEDAPPGLVFLDADEAARQFDSPPPDLVPYVDIESFADGAYLRALSAHAEALDIDARSLSGNFSAVWINSALGRLEGAQLPDTIDVEDESLPRGYAYHSLLKTEQYSRIGSRYLVALRPFEALAKKLWDASDGKSESLMGVEQRAWFKKTLRDSTRTFKVWGSEIAFMPRHIDLSDIPAAPPELQTRLSISAEDWDGFPNERRAILKELADVGNVVILSGDLHSFFAGTPFLDGSPDTRVVELTTGSATSTTWLDSINQTFAEDSSLPMNVRLLVSLVPTLLRNRELKPNPHLAFQELKSNGYSLVEAGPTELSLTVRTLDSGQVATPPSSLKKPLASLVASTLFRVKSGSAELEQEVDGEFLTWSREELDFV